MPSTCQALWFLAHGYMFSGIPSQMPHLHSHVSLGYLWGLKWSKWLISWAGAKNSDLRGSALSGRQPIQKAHHFSSLWSSALPVAEWFISTLRQVSARQLWQISSHLYKLFCNKGHFELYFFVLLYLFLNWLEGEESVINWPFWNSNIYHCITEPKSARNIIGTHSY